MNWTSTYPPFGSILVTWPTGIPSTATVLPSYSPAALSNCAVTVIVSILSCTIRQPTTATTSASARPAAPSAIILRLVILICSP